MSALEQALAAWQLRLGSESVSISASSLREAFYPGGRGKNWGYGSGVPPADGCVLLDLSRMNRIVDYDERLGYITVEPGVTFRQAYDFLRAQNSMLLLSLTGGSPDSSLIGNTMER